MVRMPDFCQSRRISLESIARMARGVVQCAGGTSGYCAAPGLGQCRSLPCQAAAGCNLWTSYFAVRCCSRGRRMGDRIRSSGFAFLASCRRFLITWAFFRGIGQVALSRAMPQSVSHAEQCNKPFFIKIPPWRLFRGKTHLPSKMP